MLIYDKSARESRHRILLSFFDVEILTTQERVARLDLQMVISPQQRKIIKFCGVILLHLGMLLVSDAFLPLYWGLSLVAHWFLPDEFTLFTYLYLFIDNMSLFCVNI